MSKVAILKDKSGYTIKKDPQIQKLVDDGHQVVTYIQNDSRTKLYFKYLDLYKNNEDDNATKAIVEHYKKSIIEPHI